MPQAISFLSCILFFVFTLSSYAEIINSSKDIQYVSENGISWRVYNSFRLFNRPDDLNKYIKYADKGLKEQYEDIEHHITSKTEDHPIFHLRYNRKRRVYNKDLVYYEYFKINAYKENGQSSEKCDWFVAGKKQISSACTNIVTLKIPYHQWDNPNEYLPSSVIKQSKISVISSKQITQTATIKAKHKLIVSMGDSFASGQGNPDIPSVPSLDNPKKRFSKTRHIRDVTYDRQASWFDDLCNRSLWSGHSLAAMKMAKNSPNTIVSFVSTACTGADIIDGLLFRQQKPTYDSTEYSQLDELSNLLIGSCYKEQYKKGDYLAYDQLIKNDFKPTNCADNIFTYQKKLEKENIRKIDNLLLSIGGNDNGFVPTMMWALFPNTKEKWFSRNILNIFEVVFDFAKISCPFGTEDNKSRSCDKSGYWSHLLRKELFANRFPRLLDRLNLLNIQNITHIGYPDIFQDQDNITYETPNLFSDVKSKDESRYESEYEDISSNIKACYKCVDQNDENLKIDFLVSKIRNKAISVNREEKQSIIMTDGYLQLCKARGGKRQFINKHNCWDPFLKGIIGALDIGQNFGYHANNVLRSPTFSWDDRWHIQNWDVSIEAFDMKKAKMHLFMPMQRHFEALSHVINNEQFEKPWGESPIEYTYISLNKKGAVSTESKTEIVTDKDELGDLSDHINALDDEGNSKFLFKFSFLDINKNNDFDKHGFGARHQNDFKFLEDGTFKFIEDKDYSKHNLYIPKQSYVRNATESLLYQGHGVDYNIHLRPEKYVLNGMMHPTAESHAIIGDMLYEEINKNE